MLAVSGYVHVTDDKCRYVKILCKLPKYLTEAMLKSSVALHLQNDCSTYAEFCAAFQQCTTTECSKIVKQAFEFAAKRRCSDIELHDIKYITGVVMQDVVHAKYDATVQYCRLHHKHIALIVYEGEIFGTVAQLQQLFDSKIAKYQ